MSFNRQKKALILLIRESSAELWLWQQNSLSLLQKMMSNADDQQHFIDQIQLYESYPVILVTDLIDENFRHDTIVHVGGSDREALLTRKLDFAFRNTKYRIGLITGRLEEGRKDDKILLCALSKSDRIDPWVNLLLQERMAIQAITSVAHLVGSFLPYAKLDHEDNLLITKLDNDNNLRQTFVKKGKVLFSRQVTINTLTEDSVEHEIVQETIQLRQYLERIQFLSYESKLNIQLMGRLAEQNENFISLSTDYNIFNIINTDTPTNNFSLNHHSENTSPAIFLIASVLTNKSIENIYAPPFITRFNDLKKLASIMLVAAATILLAGLGFNIPGALDILEKNKQTNSLMATTIPLRNQYELLRKSFPETALPPREMDLIVSTYDLLKQQIFSPTEEFNFIASALTYSPELLLRSISWELTEHASALSTASRANNTRPLFALTENNRLSNYILQQNTEIQLIIEGEVYSKSGYREAQKQVQDFIVALSQNDQAEVEALQLPVDENSNSTQSITIDDKEIRAPFSLKLSIMKKSAVIAGQGGINR